MRSVLLITLISACVSQFDSNKDQLEQNEQDVHDSIDTVIDSGTSVTPSVSDSDTTEPVIMDFSVGCYDNSYATISDAIEFAPDGTIITICQGVYLDNLVINNRRLTLVGDYFVFIKPLDTALPVITMTDGADVSLTNLDFIDAISGVIVTTDSIINVYDSVFTHNSAVTGSVIRMEGGSGGIYNSNISSNTTTGQSRGAIEMVDSDIGPANLWMEKVFWNSGDPAWGSFDRNVDWDVLFTPQGTWPYGTRFTYLHNDASFLCTTDEAVNPTEHPGFCIVPF